MPEYADLNGKIAVVTGGANGIGAAIVRSLAAQKVHVCFCDVDLQAGENLAMQTTGSQFSEVNLGNEHEVRKWIQSVGKTYHKIDIVVNNAARDPRIAFEQMTSSQWDDLFSLNLRSYFLTCQEALPFMPEYSSIVNLSSITFHTAPSHMSAYVATKAGIIGFTRSLARELGPKKIRFNVVSPGWVMTDRQLREHVTEETKILISKSQCLPDLLQPEDIAEVVLFLASNASSAISGQEILADRGWAHS
ncbi:MAG: SDR family NAD(P)-dependent oxidoreductase [Verrucomicrobiales bacterium]